MPPPFDKKVLLETLNQIRSKMRQEPKSTPDFNKIYWDNLFLKYTKAIPDKCWIKIESPGVIGKFEDKSKYMDVVKKLRALSRKNWCTRDCSAEDYIDKGHFYIYIENKEPKVGIATSEYGANMIEDSRDGIAGEKNNHRKPVKYAKVIVNFIKEKGFDNEDTIKSFQDLEIKVNGIIKRFGNEIRDKKYKNILEYLGYEPKVLEDGMLEIGHFDQPEDFALSDIGIDENELFKQIKSIRGDARFQYSDVTDLGNLEYIGGEGNAKYSHISNIGKLSKWDLIRE
jgi:hypothetical protein